MAGKYVAVDSGAGVRVGLGASVAVGVIDSGSIVGSGNGVNVAVCKSHHALGGGWVGIGVNVAVPVLRAI